MLQQTQVAVVLPYWTAFLARFPTIEALAAAPQDAVLTAWKGLGYYGRARNLHRAAQVVAQEHAGRLPDTLEALKELPGFGPYTAGAVASIAFGREAPIVDGNVARLFARLFEVEGPPGERAREKQLWAHATALVKGPRPGDLNQSLMELGATVCRPEAPQCPACPVRAHCGALSHGRVDELPPPKVRRAPTPLRLAVAVWQRKDRFLLARRVDRGLFGGLWELPTAPLGEDDTPAGAEAGLSLVLGTKLALGPGLGRIERTLTHRALTLELFPVRAGRAPKSPGDGYVEQAWCTADEARALGMSTAMTHALDLALRRSRTPQPIARPEVATPLSAPGQRRRRAG